MNRVAPFPMHSLRVAIAWLLPFALCVVQWYFWGTIALDSWFFFYPIVLFAIWIGAEKGGIGATIVATGLAWYFFLPPQQSWMLASGLQAFSLVVLLGTGIACSLVYRHVRDGNARLRRSEERLRYALDAADEGRPLRIVGTDVDIPDRKVAEEELEANRAMYRLLAENSTDAIAMFDADGNMIYLSPAYSRRLGYSEQELLGLRAPGILELIHPDDRSRIAAEIQGGREGRLPTSTYDFRVRTKSGEYLWLEDNLRREFDAGGNLVRTIVNSRNISIRKQAEQQLLDSEERFRLVVENSPDAITIWNERGVVQYVSPAFSQLFGLEAEALMRRTAMYSGFAEQVAQDELTPERLVEIGAPNPDYARNWLRTLEVIRYCIEHPGTKVQYEARLPTSTGDFRDVLHLYQGFSRRSSGGEVVAILHDLTEHRTFERFLQETNARLEQQVSARTEQLQMAIDELQRANAGKDAFMAAVSHELRTPLMGILSLGELLQSGVRGSLNAQQAKYVATMIASSRRLSETVDLVLLYTQLMSGARVPRVETCHLRELCANVIRSVAQAAERKGQQIQLAVEPYGLAIDSDSQVITQILEILLDNAVKFTPEQGTLTLTAGVLAERSIRVVVADTGIGMTEEQMAGLFRPFSQGDRSLARRYEGLGLGLACVQKLAELLDGSVQVESVPGQGSFFTITLPDLRDGTRAYASSASANLLGGSVAAANGLT